MVDRIQAVVVLMVVFVTSCGNDKHPDTQKTSQLKWLQSRSTDQRYAHITADDLRDTFLMGANVTAVKGFHSGALNMSMRPVKVHLSMNTSTGSPRVEVISKEKRKSLFAFDLAVHRGYWEVDFASSGNDLKLQQLVAQVGGAYTAMNENAYWLSDGPPKVTRVLQDEDTMVVDLLHTVRLVELATNVWGRRHIARILSDHSGQVNVRLWLQRQASVSPFAMVRTVGQGKSQNIGYFGSNFVPDVSHEQDEPIQRFDTSKPIIFYLKDFPEQFYPAAEEAATSWNQAFGRELIQVKKASNDIDAGDPRYHVIKWFDDTDENLSWAGVAKMIVDPDSGRVMSGTVYIQGSRLVDLYRKIVGFSEAMVDVQSLSGSIGGGDFSWDHGETPVIPFLTDTTKSFAEYMHGYYLETIAHEVGHVMGLRHNFKASAELDDMGHSASVMDYLPRSERSDYVGPGVYDIAAIKWGYFGIAPTTVLPFCTDDDVWTIWNCSKGDYDDPVAYVVDGMRDGARLLASRPVAITDDSQISSMAGLVEKGLKMWNLREHMPSPARNLMEAHLPEAYESLRKLEPSLSLSASERQVVRKNIDLLQEQIEKKLQEIPSYLTVLPLFSY